MTPRDKFKIIGRTVEESDHNKFDENFFNLPNDINIKGFFQFTKYFSHCEELIKEEFTPKEDFLNPALETLEELKKDGHEIVSIHGLYV